MFIEIMKKYDKFKMILYVNMNAYKLFVLDVGLLGALSELAAESISTLKYMEQEWMVNIPLYAVCNL